MFSILPTHPLSSCICVNVIYAPQERILMNISNKINIDKNTGLQDVFVNVKYSLRALKF